jgi:putative transposase
MRWCCHGSAGVAMKEPTCKFAKWGGRVLSSTCRREADRWYCSLTVEVTRPDPAPVVGPAVGVDRGIHTFAVCSDGTSIQNPKALQRNLRTLRHRSRAVSRKQKGSRNRAKATLVLAQCHRKVRNQRLDALHKATMMLAKAKSVIVVEDLQVAGLVRNRRLARAISDQGWAAFHRQLAYKCDWVWIETAASAAILPVVQAVLGLRAGQGQLAAGRADVHRQGCGLVIDRDRNAARNLAQLAHRGAWVAGSSSETSINACRAGSAGQAGNGLVKLPAAKQERTRIHGDTLTDA